MSETKPPTTAPAAGAVIRRLDAAEETAHERLVRKHVPAWVISGAIHVGLIAVMIVLFGARTADTKPPEKVVATSVEKEEIPPEDDLTNEDLGLQANLEAALPELERIDQQTVQAAVTQDHLGQPDVPETDSVALAVPGLDTGDLTNPGAVGDAGDVMSGTGGGGGTQFASFPGRSGATKSKLLREGGGNSESERAVAMGLAWLAKQQKQDGGWEFGKDFHADRVAATGMALLPFLAAGETHKAGKKYSRVVASGLAFLIRHTPYSGAASGRMSGNMYAQGIGTMALCEAYGMTKDKALLWAPSQAAVNYIQQAQGPNGSWGYSANKDGDTSIVGWQIQALKAAQLSKDLVVDARVIKKAIEFLELAGGGSQKATYGYRDSAGAAPGTSLTAVGLLCRYYIDGWDPANAAMAEGVIGLMRKAPTEKEKTRLDMYYYYYATQVVHFFEGDEWKTWNEGPKSADGTRKGGMRDLLIKLQEKKAGPDQGSWEADAGSIGRSCGKLGTTALSVLTLEVYYRHLPLYKRNNAGDGALNR